MRRAWFDRRVKDAAAEDALARLYAAPLDEFVKVRRAIVDELRAAGEASSARRVAEARKPSRTAWALNQVVRADAAVVRAALHAYAAASDVQARGEAHAMRAAIEAHRARVADVVGAVRGVLREARIEATPAQLRSVAETLRAAAGEDAVRAQLLAGRLEADAALDDPFAALGADDGEVARDAPKREDAVRGHARTREEANKREQAKEREAKQREAKQREAKQREAEKERARAEAEARREISATERALEKAKETLARADAERDRAAREVDALTKKLAAARAKA